MCGKLILKYFECIFNDFNSDNLLRTARGDFSCLPEKHPPIRNCLVSVTNNQYLQAN